MKQRQASITAQGIALVRALEAQKPADQRICFDPVARCFVPALLLFVGPFLSRFAARRTKGVGEYLVARTRYFDDFIVFTLSQGIQQLVVLGAGYDSRPYRLPALKSLTHIFEVDHPATQQVKRARLQRCGVTVPKQISYVPIDFQSEGFDKLFASGYQSDVPTLFVWEGVTYYLTAEAVDQTLTFVRDHAAPSSVLLFDYVYAEALTPKPEDALTQRLRRMGEPLIFGIPQGEIEPFLKERGLLLRTLVTHVELEQLYFQGKTNNRQVASMYAIASAATKER